jgi:hypothetical protein
MERQYDKAKSCCRVPSGSAKCDRQVIGFYKTVINEAISSNNNKYTEVEK